MPALSLSSTRTTPRPAPRLPVLKLWLQRIETRNILAGLHPEQIRDAGLDPQRIRDEIGKPFWRG